MEFSRFVTLATVFAVALFCASRAMADQINVQFSGIINLSNAPGVEVGESFSGGFSYSTNDLFDTSVDGLYEYSMVSPEDSLFVSVGGLEVSLAPPLNGMTIDLGQGPVFIDPNPDQDYFSIQTSSTSASRISIQLLGDLAFLSSSALPDPFNAGDVTLGPESLPSSVSIFFGSSSASGNITEISAVPEPRGMAWVGLALITLAALVSRRSTILSRS
jgi:hypothetical protein